MNRSIPRDPGGEPELALYCLAHAGGSALPYKRWKAFLPPSVAVEPLELPGHGARIREPLVENAGRLAEQLVRKIAGRGDHRFALYGHSFGAVLGYEVARRLARTGGPRPAALLVSGRNGPSRPLSHRPIHKLPDEQFVAALSRYGGMPQALLDEAELLRLYLPALRADLTIVETYQRPPGPPLDVPLTVLSGRRDTLTDPEGLVAWESETTGAFELALLPGGHFFQDSAEFQAVFASRLSRLAPAAGEGAAKKKEEALAG